LNYNGRMYKLVRQMPIHQFTRKDGSIIADKYNAWKEWLDTDHVFKTQTHFLFCETVPDVSWEDVPIENC
jgi:hypothetical protein